MNGISLLSYGRGSFSSNGWTCRKCFSSIRRLKSSKPQIRYKSDQKNPPRLRSKHVTFFAVAAGATGIAVAFTFKDNIKHTFNATLRSGRVLQTLILNMLDYRRTLNQNEKIEDIEQRNNSLTACHQRCADRTLNIMKKNRGIFIKLGQHLSAMGYLLPLPWTKTFIPLQDKCPESSFESIEAMFKSDTGTDISQYFSEFSHEPIGSASLAQVHTARIRETGQQVAVKFQHPAVAEWASLDLMLTKFTFSTLKTFFPNYDLEWLSDEIEFSLPQELDFTQEGKNAIRTKEYFAKFPKLPLVIPDIIWSKKRILVMENVSGHRPDDLEYLDKNGIDRDEVSAALSRIFNQMIFGNGAPLHCDPHGGNIAIRKNENRRACNFDVVLYDHGLYRDIPIETRRSYAKLWLAVIDADESRMRKYAKEVAGITDDKFMIFASAITGREFRIVQTDISKSHTAEEKEHINKALGQGMLQQLVELLGQVPRIILLILKTNDLTRSLDENLHTRHGPLRTFLILAHYCSQTIFEESVEDLKKRGSLLWPSNTICYFQSLFSFLRVQFRLEAFELALVVKRSWQGYIKQSVF